MGLSATQRIGATNAVNDASSSRVKTFGINLTANFTSKLWLDIGNRYLNDCFSQIQADASTVNGISNSDLGQYLAASIFTHTSDSWRYISSATSSLLDGDYSECIHFAYYAELRAVMSIFASSGIGINNNQNYYINSNGEIIFFSGATHALVWPLLEDWAQVQANADRLLDAIAVDGHSVSDWLTALSVSLGRVSTPLVASEILKQWGIDLSLMSQDHLARNRASYRPSSELLPFSKPSRNQVLGHLLQTWEDTEPDAPGSFRNIDTEFLRGVIEKTVEIAKRIPASDPRFLPLYRMEVDKAMSHLSVTNPKTESILKRLRATNNCSVISTAQNGFSSPDDVGGVYSRAFLLARLASAMTLKYMQLCSIGWHDLDFWWEPLGERLWFWQSGSPPTSMADLWADVEIETEAIWDTITLNSNWFNLAQTNSTELFALRRFDRAFLWAVGS